MSGASFVGTALWLAALAQTPASESQISVWNDPPPPRRTAIAGRLGLFGMGAGLRHHWIKRFSTELSGFALFGRRHGQFSLSFELRLVPIRRRKFWFHVCAPFVWEHQRSRTPKGESLAPDPRVVRSSKFFFGAGPGVEFFVHPLVSLSMEFPYGSAWRLGEPISFTGPILSASMGLYVYFR